MLRTDHPSNSKQDGVCIFYKETLGVHIGKSLSLFVESQNTKGYVGVVDRSPRAKISLNLKVFCQILRKF